MVFVEMITEYLSANVVFTQKVEVFASVEIKFDKFYYIDPRCDFLPPCSESNYCLRNGDQLCDVIAYDIGISDKVCSCPGYNICLNFSQNT
jgi:hypothetical protein